MQFYLFQKAKIRYGWAFVTSEILKHGTARPFF